MRLLWRKRPQGDLLLQAESGAPHPVSNEGKKFPFLQLSMATGNFVLHKNKFKRRTKVAEKKKLL
jgi:hypothetical protein